MISIIAAIGKNGELGKDNNLIWHLPGDLKFFKNTTTNHSIIMGYNTFLSIGKALPNRKNIIIVHDKSLIKNEEVIVYDDIDEMIKNEINKNKEVFIIGGSSLYNYFYPIADRMYLTLIDDEDNSADVYFPKIDNNEWNMITIKEGEDNNIKYKHVLFERKK